MAENRHSSVLKIGTASFLCLLLAMTSPGFAEESKADDIGMCESPESVLLALAREGATIDARRTAAEAAEFRAALAHEAVLVDIARLEALKAEIESFVADSERRRGEETRRLVNVYEAMKPEEAARLLDDLEISVTIAVFSIMAERRAAPILTRMDPVRAQAISRILVEMAKLPEDRNLSGIRIR